MTAPGQPRLPAAITQFDIDRPAVLPGEPVTVAWRTDYAVMVRITPPDGMPIDLDASRGSGSYRFAATTTGMIRFVAYGAVGQPAETSSPITVIDAPRTMPILQPEGPPVPSSDGPPPSVLDQTPLGIMRSSVHDRPEEDRELPRRARPDEGEHLPRRPSVRTTLRRWLVALAGARDDVLAQTAVDRFRYTATAGVLLTTAAVAAVSAIFALTTAVHAPLAMAILVGIGWGVVILNLDRLLTVGMTRQGGWVRNIIAALPRLAMAILLGAVISTPLVLRIFQPEIDAELKVLHDQNSATFQQQLASNPEYAAIPGLQQQLAKQQSIANQDPAAVATQDPAVKAAQQQADTANTTYQTAEQVAQAEVDGTAGTRIPGAGTSAKEKQDAAAVALQAYQNAEANLKTATATAQTAARNSSAAAAQQARQIQQQLTKAHADQANDQAVYNASEANDDGLLARMEALSALGGARPSLGVTETMLFLLFMTIELLPVLMKLLQLFGPPSMYERLIEQMEQEGSTSFARAAARQRGINDMFADYRVEQAQDLADKRYRAGIQANELLVDAETDLTHRRINEWVDQAQRQPPRATQDGYPRW